MHLTSSFFALTWLVQAALGAVYYQSTANLPSSLTFDYIVVGGGLAGGVVAARLGENSRLKVLVIEAGPSNEDVFESHPPALSPSMGIRWDWNFTVAPVPGINGGQSMPYLRAKVLGGCATHNEMAYTRGSRDDYDRWAAVTGDSSFSWNRIFGNILKAEKWTTDSENQDIRGHFDPAVHSKTGKLPVSAPFPVTPFNDGIFKVTDELKSEFPFKLDINDGRPLGIGWVHSTIDGHGTRSSSATAYLATSGSNVHVLLNTYVTRVLPARSGGVDFRQVEFASSASSAKKVLTATKEVILAGGAINTPQILLNSGIGAKADLDRLGIRTLVDNPSVGKNLTDQPAVLVNIKSSFAPTDVDTVAALPQWQKSRTGPLSKPPYLSPIAWVRLPSNSPAFQAGPDPSPGQNSPHVEIISLIIGKNSSPIVPGPSTPENKIQLGVVNLHPTARGAVSLTSANPFDKPKVDFQMLSRAVDVAILREGIRSARRLFAAKSWNGQFQESLAPPASVTSDADLDAFIKGGVAPFFHAVGSAAMSPKGAKWGVVDPDFHVKNTQNLRIVDASVFPFVTGGHTQAPVYAIAEHASEVIKSFVSASASADVSA